MRGIATSFSMTASLAVAIGCSALAVVPAIAQDAPKTESTATSSAAPEGTADHGRHHRSKHDDAAKPPDGAAKTETAASADTAAKTPTVSTTDSSAVAVIKPDTECRTFRPTGTRVPKTVCASAEDWKQVDARGLEGARQTKQTLNDASAIAAPSPPLPGGSAFGR
jgi:hypothetical protein